MLQNCAVVKLKTFHCYPPATVMHLRFACPVASRPELMDKLRLPAHVLALAPALALALALATRRRRRRRRRRSNRQAMHFILPQPICAVLRFATHCLRDSPPASEPSRQEQQQQ
eukprot:scaffold1557_cov246-Pinguiococcus_pyrenoidosus.AAC.22